MSIDLDIAAGQAARRNGRYDLAASAFQHAASRAESAAEASTLEFRALREMDISRHLIGRLLRRVGMPAARYKGFAAVDPPLGAAAVAGRLQELATGGKDAQRPDLLEADRLIRGEAPAPAGNRPPGPALRAARAAHALRAGRAGEALAQLAAARSNAPPLAETQSILGTALWRTGQRSGAASAFNLSLLYLDGTGTQGQVTFQTAYKEFRIVFCQGLFYAIPDWNDPILDASDGEAKVIVHRLPRWLRYGLRRYLPRPLLSLLHRAVSMRSLRGELPLDQMAHDSDLITLLRTVDRLGPSRP